MYLSQAYYISPAGNCTTGQTSTVVSSAGSKSIFSLKRFVFQTYDLPFYGKTYFFGSLRAGRRCVAASRFTFFHGKTLWNSSLQQKERRVSRTAFFLLQQIFPPTFRRMEEIFSRKKFLLFRTVRRKALLHDTDSTVSHFTIIIHLYYSIFIIL